MNKTAAIVILSEVINATEFEDLEVSLRPSPTSYHCKVIADSNALITYLAPMLLIYSVNDVMWDYVRVALNLHDDDISIEDRAFALGRYYAIEALLKAN